jgi:(E)-4-hydroxy-3-methylbut-2-enyl-diphosphate synthase
VRVGSVGIGGSEPIRVQSMTTADTGDVEATALQTLALAEAGCEIVRVTVPNMADAATLPALRVRLEQLGVKVPIVADIHFNPHAAMAAADCVEKVRVNPGNYADTKRFAVREYSDDEYRAELDRIREKFAPLVEKCKRLGRAMRIGTNHGSLSDRIMNRYGDSALGMVESALEFVRLCEEQDYRDLVLSMKSSNPFVAIHAYRLLAQRMAAEGMDYPFHLGVTEAGFGEDGRVKSAIGIGALLADGIGDTVRVSLTEDPVREVPVAFALVKPYNSRHAIGDRVPIDYETMNLPFEPGRRPTAEIDVGIRRIGGSTHVSPWLDLGGAADIHAFAERVRQLVAAPGSDAPLADVAHVHPETTDELMAMLATIRPALWHPDGRVPLAVTIDADMVDERSVDALAATAACVFIRPASRLGDRWTAAIEDASRRLARAGLAIGVRIDSRAVVPRETDDPEHWLLACSAAEAAASVVGTTGTMPIVAIAAPSALSGVHSVRFASSWLANGPAARAPLVLIAGDETGLGGDPLLEGASHIGGLLTDGLGDAIMLLAGTPQQRIDRALGILQATRLRMTRPDYISCPSCGRTLFDLEEVTARIQSVTSHLKGVKIAIMGCIVNGPGEMADADFGYVGSSPGKINLYVGRECVEKNVPAADADHRLIELIKAHGHWVEPPVSVTPS